MLIRPAVAHEVPDVLAMRDEAAAWLAARGSDQWSAPWPDAEQMTAGVRRAVDAGDVWVVQDGDDLVATLTLDTWANPDLWTTAEANEPARYVHRLIVRRRTAGTGLGAELLNWCGDHAARAGARWLRLDAWTTNRDLQQYYLDHGFTHVRTRRLAHNPSGALFQRPARKRSTPRLCRAR